MPASRSRLRHSDWMSMKSNPYFSQYSRSFITEWSLQKRSFASLNPIFIVDYSFSFGLLLWLPISSGVRDGARRPERYRGMKKPVCVLCPPFPARYLIHARRPVFSLRVDCITAFSRTQYIFARFIYKIPALKLDKVDNAKNRTQCCTIRLAFLDDFTAFVSFNSITVRVHYDILHANMRYYSMISSIARTCTKQKDQKHVLLVLSLSK